ncbi:MAG: integration host factor subunit beta [Nannocystis sp.]|nr:integration host factor subunit beta [Nannocystis sp.]
MTKSELIERVAEEAKLTKARAEVAVSTIFDAMIEAMKRDEGIEIRGFGTFTVRHYKPYEGRNPRTGDPVKVAPKRLPYFKIGKELRERINGLPAGDDAPAREPAPREAPSAPAASRPRPSGRHREEDLSEDVI